MKKGIVMGVVLGWCVSAFAGDTEPRMAPWDATVAESDKARDYGESIQEGAYQGAVTTELQVSNGCVCAFVNGPNGVPALVCQPAGCK